jgi:cysteine-S-conjugate beta-lyase
VASSANGRQLLSGMGPEVSASVSLLGAVATSVAFRDCEPWLDDLVAHLRETRDRLGELLQAVVPAVRWQPADHQATYLAWLDCSALGLADPAGVLENRGRVAFEPGPMFGTGGDGFVRFNFATSGQILEEAVRRMAAAIKGR